MFIPLGEDSWCYRCDGFWVSVRRDLRGHAPGAYEAALQFKAQGFAFVLAPLVGSDGRTVFSIGAFPVVVLDVHHAAGEHALSGEEARDLVAALRRVHASRLDATVPVED